MESLGFYAAAVVAANAAGLDASTLNMLTFSYLISRVLYNYVYVIAQDNRNLAPIRSLCWLTGIALTFTLYIKAAGKMA